NPGSSPPMTPTPTSPHPQLSFLLPVPRRLSSSARGLQPSPQLTERNAACVSTPSPSVPTATHLDTTALSVITQPPVAGALSDILQGNTPAPQLPVVFA